jgi:excisionase family DNA binding protein
MITIPLNTNTGIRIPAWTPTEKPERKPTEASPIGVSITQAAKMLNVGRPLMANMVKTGKIRSTKLGKRVVVSLQSLHELMDGKKEPDNSAEKTGGLRGKKE